MEDAASQLRGLLCLPGIPLPACVVFNSQPGRGKSRILQDLLSSHAPHLRVAMASCQQATVHNRFNSRLSLDGFPFSVIKSFS